MKPGSTLQCTYERHLVNTIERSLLGGDADCRYNCTNFMLIPAYRLHLLFTDMPFNLLNRIISKTQMLNVNKLTLKCLMFW